MASPNPMLYPVYRFYLNTNPALRFYTTTPGSGNVEGMTAEGPKFRAFMEQAPGTVPVYHFTLGGNHFYTLNQNDPAAAGWTNRGVAWYAFAPNSPAPQNAVALQHYVLTGSNPHVDFYTPDPNVESLGRYTAEGNIGYVFPVIISGGHYVGKTIFKPMSPEMFAPGEYQHGVIQRDASGAYLSFLITQTDPNPQVTPATPETYILYSDSPYFSWASSNIYLATSDGLPINLIPAIPLPPYVPQQEEGAQFFTTTTGAYCLLNTQGQGSSDGSFNLFSAAGLAVYSLNLLPIPGDYPLANILGTLEPGHILGFPSQIQFWQTQVAPGLNTILQQGRYTNGDLSYLDLSNQQFPNFNFGGTNFQCTKLTGTNLSGVNFTGCDLTTIFFDSKTTLSRAQSQPMIFNGATLPFTLVEKDWRWFDLTGATIQNLPYWLAADTDALQATGARLSGLNKNNLRKLPLRNAVLDYAVLDRLDLDGTDLTGASLIDASLHGTNLSNAIMSGATMTGAQFGSLARLFTLPAGAESALDAGQVSAVAPYFTQNGITLSPSATLQTLAAGRVWALDDVGNNVTYTIRLEATRVLTVYASTTAAVLSNAYLPNAVLTGANLYGVSANNIQFYGSGARIDGSAILEEAQLNDSNLSNLNLTQARLLGTNLSGAYLFNAKLNKASLLSSASGNAANLSYANLQGADFTDAQLYGTDLTNAAVAVSVPTTAFPNQGGVYLFSLPAAGSGVTLAQLEGELNAASAVFSLNPQGDAATLQKYVSALESNSLGPLKVAFIEQQPPVVLSNNATIQTIEVGSVWLIVDGQKSYTLWTDADENGDTELYAAPSLTNARAAFQQSGITLRWQATASVDAAGRQWLLDNDSENPQNLSLGYVNFLLKLDGDALDVYGTAIRVERLGDDNQLEIVTENCNVTQLGVTNLSGTTICPNGATLGVNQSESGANWDERWLRAATPPAPPTCVPTDYSWCPQTQPAAPPKTGADG